MIRSSSLPLAFIADKCGDDVAVFARGWFSILFDHLLALFAHWRRFDAFVIWVEWLKFGAAVRALYSRKITTAFLNVHTYLQLS